MEIPKLLQQWREEKVNPWEDRILQKAMDKREHMNQDASFRKEYEAREKKRSVLHMH